MSQDPYEYATLSSKYSFRIAELLAGDSGDPISCLLHVAELTEPSGIRKIGSLSLVVEI